MTPSGLAKALAGRLTFGDVVARLEAATATPDGMAGLIAAFAPQADFARRVIDTAALFRTWPKDSPEYQLAVRAERLATTIYFHRHRRCRARTTAAAPADPSFRDFWRGEVRRCWSSDDRVGALANSAAQRFVFTSAHRKALARLCRTPHIRPSRVADTLTSWERGIPLRRVSTLRLVEGITA
jgi:hypothetical protein